MASLAAAARTKASKFEAPQTLTSHLFQIKIGVMGGAKDYLGNEEEKMQPPLASKLELKKAYFCLGILYKLTKDAEN